MHMNKLDKNQNRQLDKNNIQDIKQKNKQIAVKIQTLNINGEGVSFFEGKKVCVNSALPGEEVLCDVMVEKPTFLGCKLQKILKSNEHRVTPKCKYSGVCGGCNFDFANYEDALEIKRQTLQNYFSNIFDGQVEAIKSEKQFCYRNKISFCVQNNFMGLKEEKSGNLIEIDKCLLADEKINSVLPNLKEIVKSLNCINLNHVVVRKISDSLIITFVFNKYIKSKVNILKDLLEKFKSKLKFKIGAYVNINKINHQILGYEWHHLIGIKYQNVKLFDLNFNIHPYSFLQVNDDIRDKLYNFVLDKIENQIVIEGYSGVGIMSCMLCKKAKQVFSVEINTQSYLDAEEAKAKNQILNLTNINFSCQDVLPTLVKNYPESVFLIDPPRSGCDKDTLQSLKQSNIKKIIYISCNPYTLKQNIVFLKDEYEIESLTMFDMFPNTFHMETVAILNRKNVAKK